MIKSIKKHDDNCWDNLEKFHQKKLDEQKALKKLLAALNDSYQRRK